MDAGFHSSLGYRSMAILIPQLGSFGQFLLVLVSDVKYLVGGSPDILVLGASSSGFIRT